MDRDDLEGAKAAATHFLALYAYVYNTGDLTEWKAMSHPECIFCSSVISNVEELHGAGGYETGGQILVEEIFGVPPEEGKPFVGVDVRYTQTADTEYDATGQIVDQGTPESGWIYFAMGRADGYWLVREVTVEGDE